MRLNIKILNPKSNIAICTLWGKKEVILNMLGNDKDKVSIIGTLYTTYGINYLIRTLAKYNRIDTLIVFGPDLSKSGEALVKLFSEKEIPKGLKLVWELEQIRDILDSVRIIDLRSVFGRNGCKDVLREVVRRNFKPDIVAVRKARELQLIEPVVEYFPLPLAGFYIHDEELFSLWLKAIYAVMKYGFIKESEYGEKQKEIIGLLSILEIYGHEKMNEELIKPFQQIIDPDEFNKHSEVLLKSGHDDYVSYTYGERLLDNKIFGNQIKYVVKKLSERPESRRAVAVLWLPEDMRAEAPPCMILMQGIISGEYYNHIAVFRSHDIFSAWPLNVFGQYQLAKSIIKQIREYSGKNIKLGTIVTFSISAHIYEHDWRRATELINKNKKMLRNRFVPDLRGNMILNREYIEHRTPMGEILDKYALVYSDLKFEASFLSPDHAFWLGYIIGKKGVEEK